MFGYVLAVLGIGLTVYQLFTRESDEERIAREKAEADAARAAARNTLRPAETPMPGTRRALACGMTQSDWEKTNAWTGVAFGFQLPLATRLQLMASASPVTLWPDYARRVACALQES